MADFLVDRGADTLRESLEVQRSRDRTAFCRLLVNPAVDILGRDAGTDMLSDIIENCDIDCCALFDLLNLLRSLDHIMARHLMTTHL